MVGGIGLEMVPPCHWEMQLQIGRIGLQIARRLVMVCARWHMVALWTGLDMVAPC